MGGRRIEEEGRVCLYVGLTSTLISAFLENFWLISGLLVMFFALCA